MARISLDSPRPLIVRIGEWYSRRRFGAVLEPARVLAHNPRVFRTNIRTEMSLERWNAADKSLKHLAVMAAAATIGCSWCMDFGYWVGIDEGMDVRKVHELPRWRQSDAYTDLERDVIAYAEAMSTTPPTVTDGMVEALRTVLDEAAIVELTMIVAVENQRARSTPPSGWPARASPTAANWPRSPPHRVEWRDVR